MTSTLFVANIPFVTKMVLKPNIHNIQNRLSFTSNAIQHEKQHSLTKLENYTKHNLSYSNPVPSRKKSISRLENIQVCTKNYVMIM